jgi:hypothetical protein
MNLLTIQMNIHRHYMLFMVARTCLWHDMDTIKTAQVEQYQQDLISSHMLIAQTLYDNGCLSSYIHFLMGNNSYLAGNTYPNSSIEMTNFIFILHHCNNYKPLCGLLYNNYVTKFLMFMWVVLVVIVVVEFKTNYAINAYHHVSCEIDWFIGA